MDGNSFMQIVGNGFFPVAVAGYLLVRFEAKLDALNKTLMQLCVKLGVNGNE